MLLGASKATDGAAMDEEDTEVLATMVASVPTEEAMEVMTTAAATLALPRMVIPAVMEMRTPLRKMKPVAPLSMTTAPVAMASVLMEATDTATVLMVVTARTVLMVATATVPMVAMARIVPMVAMATVPMAAMASHGIKGREQSQNSMILYHLNFKKIIFDTIDSACTITCNPS